MIPYRIELSFLTPMFFANMKQRIEDNARKGWRIKWAKQSFAIYQKQSPTDLRAQVVLFAPGILKGISKEDRKQFKQMCQDSGWSFVSQTRETQIYVTDDHTIPDIHTDEKVEWKQIQRTMKTSLFSLGIVALLFFMITMVLWQNLSLMMVLTSDLILGFLVMVAFLTLGQGLQWLVYRYWRKRNFAWLEDEDDLGDRYVFPMWFAQAMAITTEVIRWILYVGLVLSFFSVPISIMLASSPSTFIVLIISRIYRVYVDSGRQDKGTNLRILLIILFFIYITPIQHLIAPLVDKIPKPEANMQEVLVLADVGLTEKAFYHEYKPMKSIFTISQVDYIEHSSRHRIHTQRYTFRSKRYLDWYLHSLSNKHNIQPLPKVADLDGGYLTENKKSFYMIDGNSIYLISSSQVFYKESDFAGVRSKLLH